MHTLISPNEVLEIAFAASGPIDSITIHEATIIAAQQKYIRPVIGDSLCQALLDNRYSELLCQYIKAPLALYVKLIILPELTSSVGSMGIVEHHSTNFATASSTAQIHMASHIRSSATALMRRATQHLEANNELFPEYNSSRNILNRVSMDGHIVI